MSMECPPLPPTRMRHRGDKINAQGRVSALCFPKPRAIDMKRATWVMSDDAVTCPKCRALISARCEPANVGAEPVTPATEETMTTEATPGALGSNDRLGAVSEGLYLASEQRPRDGGPRFRVSDGGRAISDEDFIFDALIRVGGDFGGDALRTRYAQWMCDALNEADKTLPRVPRGA